MCVVDALSMCKMERAGLIIRVIRSHCEQKSQLQRAHRADAIRLARGTSIIAICHKITRVTPASPA